MNVLKNEFITAKINPKGAELSSVVLDGIERIGLSVLKDPGIRIRKLV